MMNGCSRAYLQAYLDEFCWRNNVGQDPDVVLQELFRAINEHFPLDGDKRVDWSDKFFDFNADDADETWLHEVEKDEKDENDDEEEEISENEMEGLSNEEFKNEEIELNMNRNLNRVTDVEMIDMLVRMRDYCEQSAPQLLTPFFELERQFYDQLN